ncbi:hypothetical protein CEXT_463221 [Caerostris extrusa]|uniref:Uncharacterized protein n=1 Tax=Caerostris extrusa TaxID=172846 RepID=A0AAV4SEL0_CAEEX|nr:hypothetical protein CEXT_463221 [Caerostris extrusa]
MRLRSNHYKKQIAPSTFCSVFPTCVPSPLGCSVVNNPGLNFYDHCAFHVYLIGILFSRRISILRVPSWLAREEFERHPQASWIATLSLLSSPFVRKCINEDHSITCGGIFVTRDTVRGAAIRFRGIRRRLPRRRDERPLNSESASQESTLLRRRRERERNKTYLDTKRRDFLQLC